MLLLIICNALRRNLSISKKISKSIPCSIKELLCSRDKENVKLGEQIFLHDHNLKEYYVYDNCKIKAFRFILFSLGGSCKSI